MIIACTGHTEEEYIKKAWCHEIDEVVPKPVRTDLMITILEEMLDYQYPEWIYIINNFEAQ